MVFSKLILAYNNHNLYINMNTVIALVALAIGLSSISSLAAGLAWLLIGVSGIVAGFKLRGSAIPIATWDDSRNVAAHAAQGWLLACLTALLLMLIPTAFWSGPWGERHPQWRLLFGALGVWLLLLSSVPTGRILRVLASAVAISTVLAYGLVVTLSSTAAPTNRIPWMAGLSLFSITLLTLSYGLKDASLTLRRLWLSSSAIVLVTALLSGVRGSWPLLLIWPFALLGMHKSEPLLWRSTWRWLLPWMVLLFTAGLFLIPEQDNPLLRIWDVITETGIYGADNAVQNDSSSGIRLILYRCGLAHVMDHPWLGTGPAEAKQLISQALAASGVMDDSIVMGHFHNDPLNPWVEFGVFGLMGYWTYAIGALWVAFRLKKALADSTFFMGLLALVLMHTATGMSNMNFAHNYYPTMFSISMALILCAVPVARRSGAPQLSN